MSEHRRVLACMDDLISQWEQAADRRSIFLTCYSMMTRNMLAAVEAGDFHDPAWVLRLLVHFAGYYFAALEACETGGPASPAVWVLAFDAARQPRTQAIQNLILGVNAHINYDLVLALADLLEPEWQALSPEQRRQRYDDHCHVNTIIAQTVDAVQDNVLERHAPAMDLIDRAFGRLDEWLISSLITRWRDQVWELAVQYVETASHEARERMRLEVEAASLQRGRLILMDWSADNQ